MMDWESSGLRSSIRSKRVNYLADEGDESSGWRRPITWLEIFRILTHIVVELHQVCVVIS